MTPTAQLVEVRKRFRSAKALGGITLDASPGVTGLLGPNGSGKTTLLRIIATALAPDSGSLRVLGENPASAAGRLAIRRQLGYLPQSPGFYDRFTAFDFVDYVAILKQMSNRAERRAEVARVLDEVGLTDQMHQEIRSLSGGMRRRVGLAQALLGDPPLLVLDEPTAGLDPVQRLRFRATISQIARGHTVLLSTNFTDDIALCPRVAVIDAGAVRFCGESRELAVMASGRVWHSASPDGTGALCRLTGDGQYRHVGDQPPPGSLPVAPTVEDGYLLLLGAPATRPARS